MPIGMQYRPMQIQPGVVHFSGIVIIEGGPAINPVETITPGVTVTRGGVGDYLMTFNDGVTVGTVAIAFTDIHPAPGDNPLSFSLLNRTNSQAGSLQLVIEINDIAGTLTDPATNGGFSFIMARLNTSVVVP